MSGNQMTLMYADGSVGVVNVQHHGDKWPDMIALTDGTEFRLEVGRYVQVVNKVSGVQPPAREG